MIIRFYKIVAAPQLITVGQSKGELAYVTLKAYEGDQPPRRLRVYERQQLHQMLGQLAFPQTAATIIDGLREGREVEVPGLYTARQLVELGFRKCFGD
jgi:hypothetical protein